MKDWLGDSFCYILLKRYNTKEGVASYHVLKPNVLQKIAQEHFLSN